MKIQVTTNSNVTAPSTQCIIDFGNGKTAHADLVEAAFDLELPEARRLYIYGDIFYHLRNDGTIKLVDLDSKQYLLKVFSEYSLEDIIPDLEGQYIGILVDEHQCTIRIFSDRYARLDTFYVEDGANFYFATDLDFIFNYVRPEYDQRMLAHVFLTYGWYTPKGLTIYKNIRQLRVGEIITLSESAVRSQIIDFKPLEIEDYTDEDLKIYYNLLRDSVIARANHTGKTWVSSSSGWDSSILLGMLVNELGPQNVGTISGSMRYSDRSEVINQFEIDKIKKISAFYGISPNIVEFDFKSNTAADYWQKVLPYYKSKHIYSYTTFNFAKLSDGLRDIEGSRQYIFNGEVSDSFHNFGFSQFATFFHTKKPFTEYADKMNCYLYGPSFLEKVLKGTYKSDKVFQIFRRMMPNIEFASELSQREDILESYLFPFFFGSPRIPFAITHKNAVLTSKGQNEIYKFPYRQYAPEVLSGLSETNIYSYLVHLYHSFHSQGSTVNVQKHSMEFNNHNWRSPYNDIRLVEHLSKAPEKWGRGLELNNTKYPLKWVARTQIKFPYELLEEGPHSYLYDVIEGFSLMAEITYRSGVTEFFKDAVGTKSYRDILDDEFFDIAYLDQLIANFMNDEEASGADFNNLVSLITLCSTGWY